jgi:serine phosphatase RsbU (regulator of sigma subunit)/rhodanese-related sulfurtransferase
MAATRNITVAQLNSLRKSGEVRLLDVRSESEYKQRHVPFAEHFPIDKIEAGNFTAYGNEIIVTACGSGGGRSERSATLIAEKLNRDVFYLEGGTFGWLKHADEAPKIKDSFLQKFIKVGHLAGDGAEEKIKKSSLLIMSFFFALAGLVWGGLYLMNGFILPGTIPFCYGIVSLLSVIHFMIRKKFKLFRFSQILLVLLLPFFLQLSLGGFMPSSAVILWSLLSPLGAVAFYGVKKSIYWFAAFVILVIIAFAVNDLLPSYTKWDISNNFINRLFLMNVLGVSALIYFMQYYFVGKQAELKYSAEIQNDEIVEKNKEITDSINYAKRIQYTLLANDSLLKENLRDHFVLFKPKDIVSGDFYWATKKGGKFYLAVCDSTGHGVPGAFMSLLNSSLLNEAINEKNIVRPDEILNYVRKKLIENISQDGGQDGMDGILLCWDTETRHLCYAAAHNSPYLVVSGTGKVLDADKMPIGKGERDQGFKLNMLTLNDNETMYLFTDGYADQFGGPKGKKFMYKHLHELLASLNDVSFSEQKRILDAAIIEWKGNLDQTDDILLIGLKL